MNKILYLITDFSYGETKIAQALAAGVDYVQLREKQITDAEYLQRAKKMRQLADYYHTKLIIDDRLDIALLSGADGVHVGQTDAGAADIRAVMGQDFIIGVTAKTVEQAVRAQKDGADYLGTGAFFATRTKADALPITEEVYRAILKAVQIPDIAIGGITCENANYPLSLGASGLAVSAGIMAENSPGEQVKAFQNLLNATS